MQTTREVALVLAAMSIPWSAVAGDYVPCAGKSPQATFANRQEAGNEQELARFFSCMDVKYQPRLTAGMILATSGAVKTDAHKKKLRNILERHGAKWPRGPVPPEDYAKLLDGADAALADVKDKPALWADVAVLAREVLGEGTPKTTERRLTNVQIRGERATGIETSPGEDPQEIEFVRRGERWYYAATWLEKR